MLGQDLHSQLRPPTSFRATQLDVRSKDSVDTKPKTLGFYFPTTSNSPNTFYSKHVKSARSCSGTCERG